MNNPLLVLTLSVVPGILWVWFFYRQDRYEKEPKPLVLKCFLFGGLMVLPAGIIEAPFRGYLEGYGGLLGLFLVVFFVVAMVEEAVKLAGVTMATNKEPHFNEPMDGIIYAVTVGLGFATCENILYIGAFGPQVGAIRAVLTNLAHASFSGVLGYYLGLAWTEEKNKRGLVAKGFIIALLMHGVYDFIILGRIVPGSFAIVYIIASYAYLRTLIVNALARSPYRS